MENPAFFLTAQENIDKYIDLIRQCGTGESKAIWTLCQWKNCRSDFYTEEKLYTGTKSELGDRRKVSLLFNLKIFLILNTVLRKHNNRDFLFSENSKELHGKSIDETMFSP